MSSSGVGEGECEERDAGGLSRDALVREGVEISQSESSGGSALVLTFEVVVVSRRGKNENDERRGGFGKRISVCRGDSREGWGVGEVGKSGRRPIGTLLKN